MGMDMNALCDFTGKWVVEGHVNYILSCMREKYDVMRKNFIEEMNCKDSGFQEVKKQ